MRAQLAVLTGEGSGQKFVIRVAQRFVIGRGTQVEVRFNDSAVSRQHAAITLNEQGQLFVTDLGSSNGTFIEGRRLEPNVPTRVLSGDAITIGANVLCAKIMAENVTRRVLDRIRKVKPELEKNPFEIIGPLGQGSYGRVYAARMQGHSEPVAVKIMNLDKDVDGEQMARFLREGNTTMRIEHHHIVRTYDVIVREDQIILVMELVNGPSLLDRLRDGSPILIPDAIRLAGHIAKGLVAAHAAGIVHRDVKPSNIMLSAKGAKLGDFGCAKDTAAREDLTETNMGLGSLPYVAPEQARNAKEADARSDIYSLGSTLFHMIAGRPPFNARGAAIFQQILEDDPPLLTDLRAGCPANIAEFVHKTLAKHPDDRPQSAEEVVDELRRIHGELVPLRKVRRLLNQDPETAQLPHGFYREPEPYED